MNNESSAQPIVTSDDIKPVTTIDSVAVKLQTEILQKTKEYLRVESVRRHVTMGQLIDELVKLWCGNVSEKSS